MMLFAREVPPAATYLKLEIGTVAAHHPERLVGNITVALHSDRETLDSRQRGHLHRIRGAAWLHAGNMGEALKDFTAAARANPDDVDSVALQLGLRCRHLGSNSGASRALERLAEKYPNRPFVRFAVGLKSYSPEANYPRAAKEFSRAIEAEPKYPVMYHFRSQARLMVADFKGCLADTNHILTTMTISEPVRPHVYQTHGEALARLGEPEKGLVFLRESHRLHPTPDVVVPLLTQLENLYGHPADVVRVCWDYVRRHPKDGDTIEMLVLALCRLGRATEAEEIARALLRHCPDSESACVSLVRSYQSQGRYGMAITTLTDYLRDHPDSLQIAGHLALALAVCPEALWRDPREAERLMRAVEKELDDTPISTYHFARACVLGANKKYDEAAAILARLLQKPLPIQEAHHAMLALAAYSQKKDFRLTKHMMWCMFHDK
jgi:tetratricopeptide (TPR) repeat protein